MADSKITALTAISTVDPTADPLVIVDVSDTSMAASGTTKKSTINQLLGSGGTATLASATITGDLTVNGQTALNTDLTVTTLGLSTLKVTAAKVGIGTSSPTETLHVAKTTATGAFARFQDSANTNYLGTDNGNFRITNAGASDLINIQQLGVFTFGDGAGGTRMTLNATGLGVGVAPSAWAAGYKVIQGQIGGFALSNDNSSNNQFRLSSNAYFDTTDNRWEYYGTSTATAYEQRVGEHRFFNAPSGTVNTAITFTQAMTLAANGQLLLGTSTTDGAIDIGMVLNKPSATGFVGNVYQFNGASKAFTYISSAAGAFRVDTVAGYTINMISATNGVYLANGGTSWTALSDERFKDIIEPISNAVAKVGSIRSVIGKFKTESEGTRRSFLIAQDVQAVLPEAVDASNPEKLGVSYTEVIPLLVAAIKELTAEVNALKNA